jgi:hypothetical protein
LGVQTRQGGETVKKIAFVATIAALLATPAQAAAPTLYPHIYSTKVTGARPAALNGTWNLSIQRTVFLVNKGSAPAVAGRLQIVGNRIAFHDTGGSFACKGAQAVGTYTWRLRGTKLTLTRVHDTCAGRPLILNGRVYTRVA